jgi:transcriptional regulator with XRE-family HTH domain
MSSRVIAGDGEARVADDLMRLERLPREITMPKSVKHDADPFDMAVGARIRFFRKQRAITQSQLAAAAQVSFQQIQKYEIGANRVSASTLNRIAAKLGVSMSDLLGETARPVGKSMDWSLFTADAAVELARAFAGVRSTAVRRQIIKSVKSLAESDLAPV